MTRIWDRQIRSWTDVPGRLLTKSSFIFFSSLLVTPNGFLSSFWLLRPFQVVSLGIVPSRAVLGTRISNHCCHWHCSQSPFQLLASCMSYLNLSCTWTPDLSVLKRRDTLVQVTSFSIRLSRSPTLHKALHASTTQQHHDFTNHDWHLN
jgi:hypothetical protein